MKPQPLVAPGNDYRSLRSVTDGPVPSVAVLIPVYNRGPLLANVLAGLSRQTFAHPFEVVVIDDGSEEDIGAVTEPYSSDLALTLLRQDRDGFGLARARNLGVSSVDADVVVFLDADCIPGHEWLSHHIAWHRKASNLVVTGSRRHIDAFLDANMISRGSVDLHDMAGQPETATGRFDTDDWRGLVYRRSQRLLLGDAGFRAAIGGNSSMRRETFLDAGGASTDFRAWGGEDTELAWRLWNAGAFVVPEDEAIIYHQNYGDAVGASERRATARKRALPLIADRVPHRFYRKSPSHLYTVPKVSWIATVGDSDEAGLVVDEVSKASYVDTELILVGDESATGRWVSAAGAARDFTVAATFGDAVTAARGEIAAIVDGRARFDRRILARMMRRFSDPRVSAVRVGYQTATDALLRMRDLAALDAADGRSGLPFFALVKRRELMKDRAALVGPGAAWNAALDRSRTELLVTDLVTVPVTPDGARGSRIPRPTDVRAAGATEIARGLRKSIRSGGSTPPPRPRTAEGADERVGIEYVGLAGHRNLGDDAMLEAIRGLMPWAEIGTGVTKPRAVMLGGGTLLNSGNYYLNKLRRVDGPNLERVVFGTGVKSESYWGTTEELADWDPFLRSALAVGLRGPASVTTMRTWGYDGPLDVIGDPALSLERPDGVEAFVGRVVVCPVFTDGDCWGGDDRAVFEAFARLIERLTAEGRDVVMLTAFPRDDRWAIEIMREAGRPNLAYLPGYEDLDAALRLVASADLVVGERLHAVVLAAAMGTPFVGVEYRPKIADFAESLGMADAVVRTDAIASLDEVVRSMTSERRAAVRGRLAEAVGRYRGLQVDLAERLRTDLER